MNILTLIENVILTTGVTLATITALLKVKVLNTIVIKFLTDFLNEHEGAVIGTVQSNKKEISDLKDRIIKLEAIAEERKNIYYKKGE